MISGQFEEISEIREFRTVLVISSKIKDFGQFWIDLGNSKISFHFRDLRISGHLEIPGFCAILEQFGNVRNFGHFGEILEILAILEESWKSKDFGALRKNLEIPGF